MNYLDAVAAVSDELAGGKSRESARAAVSLALMAWRRLGDKDVRWDRFGLAVLAASDALAGLPDVEPVCDSPNHDDRKLRAAVSRMMAGLATYVEHTATDDRIELAERLAFDAAANELRRAAAALS